MLTKVYSSKRCEECGYVWLNPVPGKRELDKYYNQAYSVPLYQDKAVRSKGGLVLRELKRRGLRKNATLLDVGASHGFFLSLAKKQGFVPRGVELSLAAVKSAKTSLGIAIENSSLGTSSFAKKANTIDAITFLDVLEHVTNQKEALKVAKRILKKDGLLAMTMPNAACTEFKLFRSNWEWFTPPAHIHFHTPQSLHILLEEGFTDIKIVSIRGDAGGNMIMQAYTAARQGIFYSLRYVVGRKRLRKIKKDIEKRMSEASEESGEEFAGFSRLVYKMSKFFDPLFAEFDKARNRRGKGPSLFVTAMKA
ncbi:MAG: class I SAM-dependent methyltransferase [Nitrosarchaeum sp.]|nr:class I SAM-dependent methyltransferase [Nitrosarchaeum sp.]